MIPYVYDAYDPGAQYVLEPFGNPSGGYDAFEVVNLNGRHIAFYNENNSRGTFFVHPNALGSDSNTTDYGGNANGEQIYAPFGQELVSGGQGVRFAGMSHRDQTGFDITPNRDYSSSIGRWLTPDPAGQRAARLADPQTWNMYAYVRNNPTTLTDPTGLLLMNPGTSLVELERTTAAEADEAYEESEQAGEATPAEPSTATEQGAAQRQDTDQSQQNQQSPQRGLTVGAGVAGNADVGVVRGRCRNQRHSCRNGLYLLQRETIRRSGSHRLDGRICWRSCGRRSQARNQALRGRRLRWRRRHILRR